MKSVDQFILRVYRSMFVDIERVIPAYRVEGERDYKRLLSIMEHRGIHFFFVDLVAAAKHFDRCLADERLSPYGIAHFGPYRRRGVIPQLFKGLHQRVFHENGLLRSDPDVQAIRFLRMLFRVFSKFRMSSPDSATWEQVDEFFRTDDEVHHPSLDWDGDGPNCVSVRDLHLGDRYDHEFRLESEGQLSLFDFNDGVSSVSFRDSLRHIQECADWVLGRYFGPFRPEEWRTKHGPGAVSDLDRFRTSKYEFRSWPDKLEAVFPYADFGFSNFGAWADALSNGNDLADSCERPARLIAVPKEFSKPRLIASEPTAHQWAQQCIAHYLGGSIATSPLKTVVHLRDQRPNGLAALEASHNGLAATVDLSSASDRLSCWLVERIFRTRPDILSAFHSVRTRYITNELCRKHLPYRKIRKFSTMGSALTFPVQSIVFAIIAIGVVRSVRHPCANARDSFDTTGVLVFGDDIVIPIDAVDRLREVLAYLGLKVNHNKTFDTGKFRESCGIDAYNGVEVTPIRIKALPEKTRPESIISCVDTINLLKRAGYDAVASELERTIPPHIRKDIRWVPMGSGLWGIEDEKFLGTPVIRWNESLHRLEYRSLVPSSRGERRLPTENWGLLQYFTEVCKPPVSREERLGVASRPRLSLKLRWEDATVLDNSI